MARPAEQVLSRIAGIEHIYSVSRPGMAVITVQYKVGEDPIQALVRLYDTINSNKDWLSPNLGVGEPIVKPKGIDDVPIVTLTFWSADPDRSAFEMQQVARAAEIELKRIPGTRDVATIGGPGHVIRVAMDADRMNAYGVTAQDLSAALQVSNASQPAGSLVTRQPRNAGADRHLHRVRRRREEAGGRRVTTRSRCSWPTSRRSIDGADQPSRYVWHGDARDGEYPGGDAVGFQEARRQCRRRRRGGHRARRKPQGHGDSRRRRIHRHPQLRRDGDRQGAEADRQAGLRHRLRRAAGAVRARARARR